MTQRNIGEFKRVELVCWGNIQRSPTGESVLKYKAGQRSLQLDIRSSGVNTLHVVAFADQLERQIELLSAGLSTDVVPDDLEARTKHFAGLHGNDDAIAELSPKEIAEIQKLYKKIRPIHIMKALQLRNEALRAAGIPSEYLRKVSTEVYFADQIRPYDFRQRYDLVLPVSAKPEKRLIEQYKNHEEGSLVKIKFYAADPSHNQVIECKSEGIVRVPKIRVYSSLFDATELKDEPGYGAKGAAEQVAYFMDTVDKALDKIMNIVNP
ncbi:MAG: hypothetical protein ABIG89_04910 [Candidatus Woesearchaeota archaeon]